MRGNSMKKTPKGGLRRRWILQSLAAVTTIVALFLLIFYFVLSDYYHNNIETNLQTRAVAAARSITLLPISNYGEFNTRMAQYIENFADLHIIEAQHITRDGRIGSTSSGLYIEHRPQTSDVVNVLNDGGISSFLGVDSFTGERVVSVTIPINDINNTRLGALRLVTSLHIADARIMQNMLEAVLLGLVAIVVLTSLNIIFINRVTKSLRDINEAAAEIADGSYGVQIATLRRDELGQLARTVNRMSTEIRAAEQLKTDFVRNVSHELRTPLTAISGWSETLLADELPEDVEMGLQVISAESERLANMVERLLDITRYDSDRQVLNMEEFNLDGELTALLDFYREVYAKDGITLVYESNGQDVKHTADRERLKQVIINLLDNAAKHGQCKHISVRLKVGVKQISLTIHDDGRGVPQEELHLIKQKYYRGATTARGNGIGLTIADDIINAHKGRLFITSEEGNGTTVVVILRRGSA